MTGTSLKQSGSSTQETESRHLEVLCRVQSGARSGLRCSGSARSPARCTPLPVVAHTCHMPVTAPHRGTSGFCGSQTSSCLTSSPATKPLAPVTTATSIIVAASRLGVVQQWSHTAAAVSAIKARHEGAWLHVPFLPYTSYSNSPPRQLDSLRLFMVFASTAPQHAVHITKYTR